MVSESADEHRLRSQKLEYDAVILGVGHSARDIYEMLLTHNVELVPKDFAVSLLIHQFLILVSIYSDACLLHFYALSICDIYQMLVFYYKVLGKMSLINGPNKLK
jgi:hypothetical protein